MLKTLFGMSRVHVNKYACRPEFRRWKRVSRRKRQNKKWRKKYGPVVACPGVAFRVDGMGYVFCPCVEAEIKKHDPCRFPTR